MDDIYYRVFIITQSIFSRLTINTSNICAVGKKVSEIFQVLLNVSISKLFLILLFTLAISKGVATGYKTFYLHSKFKLNEPSGLEVTHMLKMTTAYRLIIGNRLGPFFQLEFFWFFVLSSICLFSDYRPSVYRPSGN